MLPIVCAPAGIVTISLLLCSRRTINLPLLNTKFKIESEIWNSSLIRNTEFRTSTVYMVKLVCCSLLFHHTSIREHTYSKVELGILKQQSMIIQLIKLPAVRAPSGFHVDPPEVIDQAALFFDKVFNLKKEKVTVETDIQWIRPIDDRHPVIFLCLWYEASCTYWPDVLWSFSIHSDHWVCELLQYLLDLISSGFWILF